MVEALHSEETRAWLGRYIRQLADMMGLKDWSFELVYYPPLDGKNEAAIECRHGQKHVKLMFDQDLPAWDPEKIRSVVVHELVHPHFHAAWASIEEDLAKVLGAAHQPFFAAFDRNMEYGIDAVAQSWAEWLPLPIKGKGYGGTD